MQVEVKCAQCGKPKFVLPSRAKRSKNNFCNLGCRYKWQTENMAGENSPRWKGGKIETKCGWCGEPLFLTPLRVKNPKNNFCNTKCIGKWNSENRIGENSPCWKKKIEVKCTQCGKPKFVAPYYAKKNKDHFCNHKCFAKWKSENLAGENGAHWNGGNVEVKCDWCGKYRLVTPSLAKRSKRHFCDAKCMGKRMWKGGLPQPQYPKGYRDIRSWILERDDNQCQNTLNCRGTSKRMCVHHIMHDKKKNTKKDLISVCNSCNIRAENTNTKEDWTIYYKAKLYSLNGYTAEHIPAESLCDAIENLT